MLFLTICSTSLCRYPVDHQLNEADKSLLMEALLYHPKKDAKIGTGIKDIKVTQELFFKSSGILYINHVSCCYQYYFVASLLSWKGDLILMVLSIKCDSLKTKYHFV